MSRKQTWLVAGAAATLLVFAAAAVVAPALAQPAGAAGPAAPGAAAAPPAHGARTPAHGAAPAVVPASAAAPAAATTPPSNSEGVAAIVNDQVISSYDVRQRARLLLVLAGLQATPELLQRAGEQALRDLIDEHLQLQETAGDPYHITIADAEVDRRLTDIARTNNTTLDSFTQRLSQAGVGLATVRSQIKADIAWNRLMNGLYGSRIRISDNEIRDTQARIAASSTSTHYQISEIFLPAQTPQQFAQVQDGAMRLLEQMQQGAAFPMVARQFSAAPSAAQGGDIGWITANELPAEVANVVQRLTPGQVSLPVRTPTGVYIVALRQKQEGRPAGSATMVTLKEVTGPTARRPALERLQRRTGDCATLEHDIASIQGLQVIDLGQTSEADLAPEIRTRIANVASGSASPVDTAGDQASVIFVCARDTGGAGVPSRHDIENQLYEQEITMLSERYLNNLRRDATIITR